MKLHPDSYEMAELRAVADREDGPIRRLIEALDDREDLNDRVRELEDELAAAEAARDKLIEDFEQERDEILARLAEAENTVREIQVELDR